MRKTREKVRDSFDVGPQVPTANSADKRTGNTVFGSNAMMRKGRKTNGANFIGIELCGTAALGIDSLSDNFDVVRVAAGTNATEVIGNHSLRDRTISTLVINTMSVPHHSKFITKLPVPEVVLTPLPNPARSHIATIFNQIINAILGTSHRGTSRVLVVNQSPESQHSRGFLSPFYT